jgi:PIN domain nuclease of toxin-antitoxin system
VILLDTHVLVWLAGARQRLSPTAREAIDGDRDRAVSTASIQELAYLVARKRLNMNRPLEAWVSDALNVHGIRAVAPTVSASLRAGSLDPQRFHGDPIDRLLYATAVEHDARLVSADERLREFDPARLVW